MSRVGALLAPFLAVDLASRSAGAARGAEGIIAGCCLAAAAATVALPLETRGRQLTVHLRPYAVTCLPCVLRNLKYMAAWHGYAQR